MAEASSLGNPVRQRDRRGEKSKGPTTCATTRNYFIPKFGAHKYIHAEDKLYVRVATYGTYFKVDPATRTKKKG